jgi:hypothetical protein
MPRLVPLVPRAAMTCGRGTTTFFSCVSRDQRTCPRAARRRAHNAATASQRSRFLAARVASALADHTARATGVPRCRWPLQAPATEEPEVEVDEGNLSEMLGKLDLQLHWLWKVRGPQPCAARNKRPQRATRAARRPRPRPDRLAPPPPLPHPPRCLQPSSHESSPTLSVHALPTRSPSSRPQLQAWLRLYSPRRFTASTTTRAWSSTSTSGRSGCRTAASSAARRPRRGSPRAPSGEARRSGCASR